VPHFLLRTTSLLEALFCVGILTKWLELRRMRIRDRDRAHRFRSS
jgi:hypothetical protein